MANDDRRPDTHGVRLSRPPAIPEILDLAIEHNAAAVRSLPVGHPDRLAILQCHRQLAVTESRYHPLLACNKPRLCDVCRGRYCRYWHRRWLRQVGLSAPCRVLHLVYSPQPPQSVPDAVLAAEVLVELVQKFQQRVIDSRRRDDLPMRSALIAMHSSVNPDRGYIPLPHLHFLVLCDPYDALPNVEGMIGVMSRGVDPYQFGYTKLIRTLHIRRHPTPKQLATTRRHFATPVETANQAAYITSPFGKDSDPQFRFLCDSVMPYKRIWYSGMPVRNEQERNLLRWKMSPEIFRRYQVATLLPGSDWRVGKNRSATRRYTEQLLQLAPDDFYPSGAVGDVLLSPAAADVIVDQ